MKDISSCTCVYAIRAHEHTDLLSSSGSLSCLFSAASWAAQALQCLQNTRTVFSESFNVCRCLVKATRMDGQQLGPGKLPNKTPRLKSARFFVVNAERLAEKCCFLTHTEF